MNLINHSYSRLPRCCSIRMLPSEQLLNTDAKSATTIAIHDVRFGPQRYQTESLQNNASRRSCSVRGPYCARTAENGYRISSGREGYSFHGSSSNRRKDCQHQPELRTKISFTLRGENCEMWLECLSIQVRPDNGFLEEHRLGCVSSLCLDSRLLSSVVLHTCSMGTALIHPTANLTTYLCRAFPKPTS